MYIGPHWCIAVNICGSLIIGERRVRHHTRLCISVHLIVNTEECCLCLVTKQNRMSTIRDMRSDSIQYRFYVSRKSGTRAPSARCHFCWTLNETKIAANVRSPATIQLSIQLSIQHSIQTNNASLVCFRLLSVSLCQWLSDGQSSWRRPQYVLTHSMNMCQDLLDVVKR